MFKQLFASMNDAMDEIINQYPAAVASGKAELDNQLVVLKAMSDECIEGWLLFEEKMGQFHKLQQLAANTHQQSAAADWKLPTEPVCSSFERGQGYFKLYMFDLATREFEHALHHDPDSIAARLYLALGYFHQGDVAEAYRHFQLIVMLTDNCTIRAISYNAMGCIQAMNKHYDKAQDYFRLAHRMDPAVVHPLSILEIKAADF